MLAFVAEINSSNLAAAMYNTKLFGLRSKNMQDKMITALNSLSDEINDQYGFVTILGDNFGEPAINSGPCAPFAKTFYECWNARFIDKVHIVFIMVKNSDECWHVLIRLPNHMLFDGGVGVHSDEKYIDTFDIEDMREYNLETLERCAYGLGTEYPTYCPNFSIEVVTGLINDALDKIKQ